jgi:iduronate 2-sulfatase
MSDNTIIVLWGDHGWHLGDHGMWCKHTNYEQANRIPLLIVAPGVTKKGAHSSALVESVDLYPTLCDLAGLPKPKVTQQLDGVSLLPVLRKPKTSVKDHVTHVFPRGPRLGRAVRTERYRLVEWKPAGASPETAELELYDYKKDPSETKNLAAEQPDVVKKLRVLLAQQPEAKPQVK